MKLNLNGKYTNAVVMTDQIEEEAVNQIIQLCSSEIFKNTQIRIMPDVHSGKGCVIGFTAKVSKGIIPNLIGVDIGCSVSAYEIPSKYTQNGIDFDQLDKIIRKNIPSGMSVRQYKSELISKSFEDKVQKVCQIIDDEEKFDRHLRSIGSLGDGNHFLEIDIDEYKNYYLLIHTGSRNFGNNICKHFQKVASLSYQSKLDKQRESIFAVIPIQNREQALQELNKNKLPDDLKYLDGYDLTQYIECMKIAQEFAKLNHQVIFKEICNGMEWEQDFENQFECIFTSHNYLEFLPNNEFIIRKGAVRANKDELLLIPLNMKDGTLICKGKGNIEWNCSAPHGAGRIMSRKQAKQELSLNEFKNVMKDIWSSCVTQETLDEAPMAYKDKSTILDSIGDTVEIIKQLTPVYNYKAN